MTEQMTDQVVESTSREIEPVRMGTLQMTGPNEVVSVATQMATTLANIIKDQHLYSNIQGKNYVRVEGWTTLGAMLGVTPREVEVKMLENDDYEAKIELIRNTDGAVVGGASAIVSSDEKTWANRPRYARRSMAVTRATGKAFRLSYSWIMALAGYEPTPAEEMDGVVEGSFKEHPQPKPRPKPSAPKPEAGERPWEPDELKQVLAYNASAKAGYNASDKQRGLLAALLNEFFQDDTKRHEASKWLFREASTKKIDGAMVKVALDWLKPEKDDGGAYQIDDTAKTELSHVLTVALEAAGQEALL